MNITLTEYHRVKPVNPLDMDFHSDIKEIEAAEEPETPPKNFMDKVWKKLVRLPPLLS